MSDNEETPPEAPPGMQALQQHPQLVPLGPIQNEWNTGMTRRPLIDGTVRADVLVLVSTPAGTQGFFLSPEYALHVAANIQHEARNAIVHNEMMGPKKILGPNGAAIVRPPDDGGSTE